MDLIAEFGRQVTGLGPSAGSSNGSGLDRGDRVGDGDNSSGSGGGGGGDGGTSGGHVDKVGGDVPLNNASLGLDEPFIIDAWGERTEWPAPSVLSSLDRSIHNSPIFGSGSNFDSDTGSKFSGTDTDTDTEDYDEGDDPNSEEFMVLFAPVRYQEFLQQQIAEQSAMAQGRESNVSRWRMAVAPGTARDGPGWIVRE